MKRSKRFARRDRLTAAVTLNGRRANSLRLVESHARQLPVGAQPAILFGDEGIRNVRRGAGEARQDGRPALAATVAFKNPFGRTRMRLRWCVSWRGTGVFSARNKAGRFPNDEHAKFRRRVHIRHERLAHDGGNLPQIHGQGERPAVKSATENRRPHNSGHR